MSSGHTHMFYLFALGIVGWFSNEEKKEISIKKKQMPQFKFKLNWIQIQINLNENQNTIYSNLWNIGKGVLKSKFWTLEAYTRKQKVWQ